MTHAYTPGLMVTERLKIVKKRILPLKGEVVVKKGDQVTSEAVVARTELPGPVEPINVANILGVPPQDVPDTMLKKTGDAVNEGEEIAKSKSFFGLFTSAAKAKISGKVENISSITGQVLLRGNGLYKRDGDGCFRKRGSGGHYLGEFRTGDFRNRPGDSRPAENRVQKQHRSPYG